VRTSLEVAEVGGGVDSIGDVRASKVGDEPGGDHSGVNELGTASGEMLAVLVVDEKRQGGVGVDEERQVGVGVETAAMDVEEVTFGFPASSLPSFGRLGKYDAELRDAYWLGINADTPWE